MAWTGLACTLTLLTACGTVRGNAQQARATQPAASAPTVVRAESASADAVPGNAAPRTPRQPPEEVRTKTARFRVASPGDLPGWTQDDMRAALDAMRQSCRALERRPTWSSLCSSSVALGDDRAQIRGFFEREFTFLRVMAPDANAEGDITGYFEPLLAGSPRRTPRFSVPVYGTPNDMFTLDWTTVPVAQRDGVISVRLKGRELQPVPPGDSAAFALDLRQFDLDTRERRLRIRQEGGRLSPYFTREQIQARGQLDAPVIAWVDDAMGLYAMQVQGSGRIKMPDGAILRLGFAEQNGHPFKPLRVAAAAPKERVVTRGARPDAAAAEEPMTFELLPDDVGDEAAAGEADDGPVTRGGLRAPPRRAPDAGRVDATVDELLARPARPNAPADVKTPRTAAAPAAKDTPVDSARKPIPPAEAAKRIGRDPSYVFFRVAPDQSNTLGPIGALGVPLTAGRSVAVDPRVTPLGYPVYLAAKAPRGSNTSPMQKLVFAQDTGGAIRGAVRADHFWGFGPEAARQANSTKHRGEMWLMMPTAEFRDLKGTRVVTRGVSGATDLDRDCLVPDAQFCAD